MLRTLVGDFSGLIDLWERGPISKNALPITVTIGAWSIVSFLADRICIGKRNGAQTLFSRANLPMKFPAKLARFHHPEGRKEISMRKRMAIIE